MLTVKGNSIITGVEILWVTDNLTAPYNNTLMLLKHKSGKLEKSFFCLTLRIINFFTVYDLGLSYNILFLPFKHPRFSL